MQAVDSYWEEAHFIGHRGEAIRVHCSIGHVSCPLSTEVAPQLEGSLISYCIGQQMQRYVTWD